MSFELNDEQRLLEQSVARFVEKDYTFERRENWRASALGFSEDNWRQFAELGWLAIALPAHCGGLEGGASEQALVCEGLGRALVLEPYVSTAVLAAKVIECVCDRDRSSEWLTAIGQGKARFALAWAERESRYDLHHVETRAVRDGERWLLSGEKIAVLDAPSAGSLIVSARCGGERRDPDGVGLFLVDRDASGSRLTPHDVMDGSRAGELSLSETPATLLVEPDQGLAALARAVDYAIVARSAQAVGAMAAAFEQTLEYAKTRKQFGTSIGSFQVIQHRLVELWMAVRESQAMVRMSAQEIATDDARERSRVASAAKRFVGIRASRLAKEIVQLHGGIGMTEELPIGHYFRGLTLYTSLFGSPEYHLRRYVSLGD